jgi:hypothetical protein
MVTLHDTHAVTAVFTLVELATVYAAGFIHIKHLPIIHPTSMTLSWHPERRTHAVPDGVDGVGRHGERVASE